MLQATNLFRRKFCVCLNRRLGFWRIRAKDILHVRNLQRLMVILFEAYISL